MIKVIGIRFRSAGKIYFFDPLQFDIHKGDNVIVETARGIEFGTAVSDIREVTDDKVIQPLKPVLRIASERDKEQEAGNKIKEKEAYTVCLEKIRKHGLDMKLIDAEYTFDNNKVLFYFTADGRIDFRELVKDLAAVFKTRIELRQIGVRDETKILGGIGICGRPLCCHTHLSDFIPVSIKMAKEQNLSLNPTKISGVCGRLMCCLKHEEDTYEELNRRLPGIGDFVTTEDGLKGEVQSVNVLRQRVKVLIDAGDEKELKEYEVEQLHFKRRHGKKEQNNLSKEEMQELERLEKEEQMESQEMGEGQKREKGDNNGRGDRNRQDRPQRSDRGGRGDRENRGERKSEGQDHGRQDRRRSEDQGEKQERNEQNGPRTDRRPEGNEQKNDRGDRRQDQGSRGERSERNEHHDRNRQDHGQKKPHHQDQIRENGQGERPAKQHRPEQTEKEPVMEGNGGEAEGSKKHGHFDHRRRHRGPRPDGGQRQEGKGKGNDNSSQG